MFYAKIVLGLPVSGPFDYSVCPQDHKKIKEGMRVWIQFGNSKKLGYAVGLSRKTNIERVKPLLEIIDNAPILDKNMLLLTRRLSDYYGCSWGEAIEAALPLALRRGKKIITNIAERGDTADKDKQGDILIHDLTEGKRWDYYLKHIKETIESHKSAIILLPDIDSVLKAKERVSAELGISPYLLYRKQSNELEVWHKIKEAEFSLVIGTRSAVFAPAGNLGLLIIEEEQDTVYKQEQVPHYHARVIASMRTAIEKARLILGSPAPSLESFYSAKKEKVKYTLLPRTAGFPQVKVIDMRRERINFKQNEGVLSKYLLDSVNQVLDDKGKALLFLNRHGFATFASCRNCQQVLKCPRCNVNLAFHFKENLLICRHCNHKAPPPKICPSCNAAYIRYSGAGTEKVESEVSRVFPHARIKRLDSTQDFDIGQADIFISTVSIMKRKNYKFDLIGILSIDDSLNRVDFRSTEKVFGLLSGLLTLTEGKMLIQTNLPKHYLFQAIINKDADMFYNEELKQRKQLGFPPYRNLCLVKLRGRKESIVREASELLFAKLRKESKENKGVEVASLNPGQPERLRGNFYWQILIKGGSSFKIIEFLRLQLKGLRHSGIIVTVDMDPV